MTIKKILSVDDDPFFLELISSTLDNYEVITAEDAAQARFQISSNSFDLIILDINLGNDDGYTLCSELRELNAEVPVLFISSLLDLDSRLKAYGAGANDYISKPFQREELQHKIQTLIDSHHQQKALQNQAESYASLLTNIQKEAAYLQVVNRFVQTSIHCNDTDTLLKVFFAALQELNTSGIIMLADKSGQTFSSDGYTSVLESEILEMSHKLPRIHSFGKDRGLFNWKKATLMVRRVHSLVDVLAILMDSLEAALTSIEIKSGLVREISQIEASNLYCQSQVNTLIGDMTLTLQNSLVTMGIVSSLGEEEEEQICQIVKHYSDQMQQQLIEQAQHGISMRELIKQLRTPTEEVQKRLDQVTNSEYEDDIELF